MTGNARSILANTSYRVIADVTAKAASVVLYVVMARQLGAADFGVFAFGLAFVTLITVFADFGQDAILTREVARDHRRVNGYFANTIVLKLGLALPALAVSIAILTAVAEPQTRNVAALLGLAVVAEQLMATCFATFQSYERLVYIPAALVTQRFLMTGVGCVALLRGADVEAVALIYLACALVALCVALWLLFTRVVRPTMRITPRTWRGLMVAALPVGLAAVFAIVLFRADMALLAAIVSADDVGEYAAAYRLFEATLFLSWGVGAAVYPVYSRLGPTASASILVVFERSLKLVVALTLPLAAGAAIFADSIVNLLYGSDYEASSEALALLAPAIALYPVAYLSALLLVSQNRQRVLAPLYGVVAAEDILLNLVLISALSLYGAAFGTSLSQLLVTVPLLVLSSRALGQLDWLRMFAGPVVAVAAATLVAYALRNEFSFAVLAMATAYGAALYAFERLVFPGDAEIVTRLVPRRSAKR